MKREILNYLNNNCVDPEESENLNEIVSFFGISFESVDKGWIIDEKDKEDEK